MDSRALNRIATLKAVELDVDGAPVVDAIGQPVTTLVDIDTIWVNIRHQSGSEAIRSGQDTSVVLASLRARRRSDFKPSQQLVERDSGRAYLIEAVLPDENSRDHVDLLCHVLN